MKSVLAFLLLGLVGCNGACFTDLPQAKVVDVQLPDGVVPMAAEMKAAFLKDMADGTVPYPPGYPESKKVKP